MIEYYNKELDSFVNEKDLSFLTNKSIMITGASGLIGSYMVDVLMRQNERNNSNIKVYAVIRNIKGAEVRFSGYKGNEQLVLVEQDVSEENNFEFSVDYIIHAASNANPLAFDTDPIGTIKANVNGTLHLLDYAKEVNATKLLYISSTEIYGENNLKLERFTETDMGTIDPMNPRSCYTESKRMAENICVNYFKQYGVSTNIVRVGYAYGPTFTKKDNRVIPQFVRNAMNNEDIVMKSNGDLVRSYIYISDVISGIFKVLQSGADAEVYNIANRKSDVSIRDIAETVARFANTKVEYQLSDEDKAIGYAPFSMGLIDATKLENLGWEASFDLEKGIESIIEYKKQD